MNEKSYAITVKKTRKPILREHYLDYLDKLSDTGEIGNVNFETTKGMHIHFIIKTKGTLDYSKLYPTKYGWNAKAVSLFNRGGWIRYCRKDQSINQEINTPKVYPEDSEEYIDKDDPNNFPYMFRKSIKFP